MRAWDPWYKTAMALCWQNCILGRCLEGIGTFVDYDLHVGDMIAREVCDKKFCAVGYGRWTVICQVKVMNSWKIP